METKIVYLPSSLNPEITECTFKCILFLPQTVRDSFSKDSLLNGLFQHADGHLQKCSVLSFFDVDNFLKKKLIHFNILIDDVKSLSARSRRLCLNIK